MTASVISYELRWRTFLIKKVFSYFQNIKKNFG